MSQVDDTPEKFEYEGIEFTVWPRVNRRTIPLTEYVSDRDEEDQDILEHEHPQFHDTREIETEKTLTGWTVSYNNNSTWLSADDYTSVEEVVSAVEGIIDSRGS